MRAMILLGIDRGSGQSDVANLPRQKAINLSGRWVDYPRPKTAIMRRCPLWPETVEALREAISRTSQSQERSRRGANLHHEVRRSLGEDAGPREGKLAVAIDSVRLEFGKLLDATKLKRPGLGFYALRHTFRTVADGSKDQPAIDHIMGHAPDNMASLYRERIEDERLKSVVNGVRAWPLACGHWRLFSGNNPGHSVVFGTGGE